MKCWYEDSFVIGKDNQILHQVIKCNYSGDSKHVGMIPVYSEWLR